MSKVHDMFHVLMLQKYITNPSIPTTRIEDITVPNMRANMYTLLTGKVKICGASYIIDQGFVRKSLNEEATLT